MMLVKFERFSMCMVMNVELGEIEMNVLNVWKVNVLVKLLVVM